MLLVASFLHPATLPASGSPPQALAFLWTHFATPVEMLALSRLPPVSGCSYGITLPGPGLSSNLTFAAWENPVPGIIANGQVRPESLIHKVRNYYKNTQTFNQF